MRRTGHIRERSPGSFELRYDIGIDPAAGGGATADDGEFRPGDTPEAASKTLAPAEIIARGL
jgi:hypothetical protein